MSKIKLNLFDLKHKEDLININEFFKKNIKKWFNKDGSPNEEYFKKIVCPFCKDDNSKKIYDIDGFLYQKCLSCDSIYTNPHLREGVLDALYKDGAYQKYQDSLVKKSSKLRKGVLEKRKFKQIKDLIDKKNISILDVGCGGGTFLDICIENGCIAEGVDPSIESKSAQGAQVTQGNFNEIQFNKNFDVITFWGVLEHMLDPISALKKATDLLNNNGLIVFEVPSADCFMSEYLKKSCFSPTRYIESGRHNIFFSRFFIEKLTFDLNLKIALIETNGLDLQTILLEEFDTEIIEKILDMQDTLNDLLLGDHYRVFLKKN